MSTITTILLFILVLSLLVAVHEFGHFWVARRCGVKVLRFSIGFGQPLWRYRPAAGETEYVVAAIPLGGYVKMVDEREEEVSEADLPRAFNRQSLAKRFAIVFAGPLFNILFAILLYWLMFMHGVPGTLPLVGEVAPETLAAEAGVLQGDEIIAVAGRKTPTWQAVVEAVYPMMMLNEPVDLQLQRDGLLLDIRLQGDFTAQTKPEEVVDRVGLRPFALAIPAIIGTIGEGSPAAVAGIRQGDRVVAVADEPIEEWQDLVAIVQENPGHPLLFTLQRGEQLLTLEVRPLAERDAEGKAVGKIGVGVQLDEAELAKYRSEWRFGPVDAMGAALAKSGEMARLTLKLIGEMLLGRASVDNLSGPVTIAVYAKSSAVAGLSQLLGFIAIVSISLGVLNLLPIPILDGGHLLFYLIEAVKGSPLPEAVEALGQRVGMVLLLMLMSLALYNDLLRLVG
ncbi:MAG: RIP metalloprotease RseP [Gammaproteobacteria bacterium]|nr:RIP metalloprotease RseP [Gammaproteobacteria bacterium]